ncbi:MAG: META domain-containing protein [Tamlana sp.]
MQNDIEQAGENETLSGTYVISSIGANNKLPNNLTVKFDDANNKISGFAGCNCFFGNYSTDSNSLKIEVLASTKMYCENLMDVEDELLKTLGKVNVYSIDQNQISLKSEDLILIEAFLEPSDTEQSKKNYIIEYSASSRGVYNQIIINEKIISSSQKRGGEPNRKPCDEKNWNTIIEMLGSIDIETISTLKAPSKAFQYDGAAIAHLKITKGDKTYESAPFDHGNPPAEIAELVKEILSISENIE